MDDHKVDALAVRRVFNEATGSLARGLAIVEINGGIEAALGYLRDRRERGEDFLALGGVDGVDEVVQRRRDIQLALICRNLVFVHLVLRSHERIKHLRAGRHRARRLGNAAGASVDCKAESVHLRHDLRAQKLAGELSFLAFQFVIAVSFRPGLIVFRHSGQFWV